MLIGGVVINGVDMIVILVALGFIANLVVTLLVGRWLCNLIKEVIKGKDSTPSIYKP